MEKNTLNLERKQHKLLSQNQSLTLEYNRIEIAGLVEKSIKQDIECIQTVEKYKDINKKLLDENKHLKTNNLEVVDWKRRAQKFKQEAESLRASQNSKKINTIESKDSDRKSIELNTPLQEFNRKDVSNLRKNESTILQAKNQITFKKPVKRENLFKPLPTTQQLSNSRTQKSIASYMK